MRYVLVFGFLGLVLPRVGIIGTNFFIAIIDKILEIIAILSVIGDNFGKQKIIIFEEIFSECVVAITCILCTYCHNQAL